MAKKDFLKEFHQEYLDALNEIENKNPFPEYFYDQFLAGEVTIYQKNIAETKTFEEDWIRTLESYFPSLNKIISDPKTTLRYDEEIVIIEKARKTTAKSVKHLAANTYNIKEVRDDIIIPKKILTEFPEEEYATYENRLVMTLIDKLFYFVKHRHEIIKNNIESFQTKHFNLNASFPFNEIDVDYKIDIRLKEDLDDQSINEYNLNLLKRVEHLSKLVTSFKQSSFMEKMKNQRKVYPPLIKSNIILKNVDYHNAYLLWLFLDRYNTLAYDLTVDEKDLTFDDEYLKDIYKTSLINLTTVLYNQEKRKELYDLIKSTEVKRKGVRVVKYHPDDLIVTPEPFEVEDTMLNQYYLEKYKELFTKALSYHETQSRNYEVSLKRALRETLQITNALYESFFELNEEEDVFRRLIKEPDPLKELNDAKERAIIAKLIREVKEVDYKDSIRQERRLLKQIARLDKKLIDAQAKRKLITSKKLRGESELRLEREKALKEEKALAKELTQINIYDDEIKVLRNKIHDDIIALQRELKKDEELHLTNLTKELDKEFQTKMNDLENQIKKKETELLVKQTKLKASLVDSFKKEEARLKEEKQQELLAKEAKLLKEKEKLLKAEELKTTQKLKEIEKEIVDVEDSIVNSIPKTKDVKTLNELPYVKLVILAKNLGIVNVSNYPKQVLINLIVNEVKDK